MWLIARYQPVSAFSLRSSMATSSGGRTNLVPTMYSVKLALVDAAFRADEDAEAVFASVKNAAVRFSVPRRIVVNNAFIKIQREPKDKASGPTFISSVAFREFCHYQGDLNVALDVRGLAPADRDRVRRVLAHISYFGKRGSFFQFTETEDFDMDGLPPHFGYVEGDARERLSRDVVMQYLDDVGPGATFDRINSYSETPARVGRDRVLVPVSLPLRRAASSRGYTLYERTIESDADRSSSSL